jgi:23S rRNA (cytidine2498-2'-O)-methyltransferase
MDPAWPRLHIIFLRSDSAVVGLSYPGNSSPWPMGIPRLRAARGAPSRAGLKLEEAFLTLLTASEREERLRAGMVAVDLGAAPSGWSWQLARRGLSVTAVATGHCAGMSRDRGSSDTCARTASASAPRAPWTGWSATSWTVPTG